MRPFRVKFRKSRNRQLATSSAWDSLFFGGSNGSSCSSSGWWESYTLWNALPWRVRHLFPCKSLPETQQPLSVSNSYIIREARPKAPSWRHFRHREHLRRGVWQCHRIPSTPTLHRHVIVQRRKKSTLFRQLWLCCPSFIGTPRSRPVESIYAKINLCSIIALHPKSINTGTNIFLSCSDAFFGRVDLESLFPSSSSLFLSIMFLLSF